jgi:DNA-binding MarR family transcriptional regulator
VEKDGGLGLAGPDTDQERAWELYVRSHALLERALDAELRAEHGMSLLTLDTLVQLSRAPGQAMYMKDIAAALVYSASGITRVVDSLERSGYVARQQDPTNRRATLVCLTPQGRLALESAWAPHAQMVQRWFTRHVDADQAKVLIEVFGAVEQELRHGD